MQMVSKEEAIRPVVVNLYVGLARKAGNKKLPVAQQSRQL
jgi:hypothetical protein